MHRKFVNGLTEQLQTCLWEIRAPFLYSVGLTGSANLTLQVKFVPNQPVTMVMPVTMETKTSELKEIIRHYSACIGHMSSIPARSGVIDIDEFNCE